jgi:hypothetical protein
MDGSNYRYLKEQQDLNISLDITVSFVDHKGEVKEKIKYSTCSIDTISRGGMSYDDNNLLITQVSFIPSSIEFLK